MADKKINAGIGLAVLAVILLAAVGYFILSSRSENVPQTTIEEGQDTSTVAVEVTPSEMVEKALSERVLGNKAAPIKIEEFSSLTCSHCGHFHKETFKALKEKYLDSGKAYLVLSDFPLNAPAMHASMIARCLPADKYFDFVQGLFEEQDKWAYDMGYVNYLKSKSAEFGLSQEDFEVCIQSPEIQEGILKRMQAAQSQWQISSTPSFVINNKEVISGAVPLTVFEEAMNPGNASSENGESSP